MTPPSAFDLPRSEFSAFLFAAIGEESNGMTCTVVSAMARLDVDPWQEAARLSDLPNDIAAASMRQMICKLPGGQWDRSDVGGIAARLVQLLPRPGRNARPGHVNPRRRERTAFSAVLWLASLMLAAAISYSVMADRDVPSGDAASDSATTGFSSPPNTGR